MKQLVIHEPNNLSIEDSDIPALGVKDVLIKIMYSGICGTDIHILKGSYLGAYPVVPGHEFAGIVEEIGSGVSRYLKGDRVAIEPNISCNNCVNCLNNRQNFCSNWQAVGVTLPGGMAEYVVVPENAVFDIGDCSFKEGAFVEPLSCVIHGIQKVSVPLGSKIAVLGAGPIGLLLLQCLQLQGAYEITVMDRIFSRLTLAEEYGAQICLDSLDGLKSDSYDLVVDATGVVSVMQRTIDLARPGGRILWFGVPPSGIAMEIEPFKIFKKGLNICGSFTSVRNSYQAVNLLKSKKINVSNLVSHILPLKDFLLGVELIENGEDNVKKVMIQP